MKNLYFLFSILLLQSTTTQTFAQQSFSASPRLSLSLAFQEHDRRLFGWPARPSANILEHENNLGSSARVYAQGQTLSAFHFRKGANHLRILNKWVADFYSLEVNAGLGVAWKNWDVALSYRAWQVKQRDTVLFWQSLFPPHLYDEIPPQDTETYNPFKVWLTVGYVLTPESEARQFLRRRRAKRDSLKE